MSALTLTNEQREQRDRARSVILAQYPGRDTVARRRQAKKDLAEYLAIELRGYVKGNHSRMLKPVTDRKGDPDHYGDRRSLRQKVMAAIDNVFQNTISLNVALLKAADIVAADALDVVKNQHPALDSDILQTERAGRVAIITLSALQEMIDRILADDRTEQGLSDWELGYWKGAKQPLMTELRGTVQAFSRCADYEQEQLFLRQVNTLTELFISVQFARRRSGFLPIHGPGPQYADAYIASAIAAANVEVGKMSGSGVPTELTLYPSASSHPPVALEKSRGGLARLFKLPRRAKNPGNLSQTSLDRPPVPGPSTTQHSLAKDRCEVELADAGHARRAFMTERMAARYGY